MSEIIYRFIPKDKEEEFKFRETLYKYEYELNNEERDAMVFYISTKLKRYSFIPRILDNIQDCELIKVNLIKAKSLIKNSIIKEEDSIQVKILKELKSINRKLKIMVKSK